MDEWSRIYHSSLGYHFERVGERVRQQQSGPMLSIWPALGVRCRRLAMPFDGDPGRAPSRAPQRVHSAPTLVVFVPSQGQSCELVMKASHN